MKQARRIIIFFLVIAITCVNSQTLIRNKEAAHEAGVTALCISADGSTILSGGADAKTFLWNINTGEKQKGALKQNDKVNALAISANGKFYITSCSDMRIREVDIEQGIPVRVLAEHTGEVTALAFNPVNDFFASGSKDNTIRVWDNNIKNRTSLLTLKGHEKPITAIVFSPDGKTLCSASLDNTIKFWDASSGELKNTLTAGVQGVLAITYSSDGKYLASGDGTGNVIIWESNSGAKIVELKNMRTQINALSFSPDIQYLAIATNDKKITISKVESGKEEKSFTAHESAVTAVAFSNKGDFLVSGGKDGNLKTWDVTDFKLGKLKFAKAEEEPKITSSELSLKDENNNGILDGGEKANLVFILRNQGKGPAYNLIAKISTDPLTNDINFEKEVHIGNIDAGKSQTVSIPITVNAEMPIGTGTFHICLTEANGFNPPPLQMNYQTGGASSYSYIMVSGQSYTSATGKAQIGAPITLKLKVKNIAKTEAKNIKIIYLLPEHVRAVNKLAEVIPNMGPGEEKEVQMDFYAESTFTANEIKMCIDIQGVAFTNAKDIILKVPMNAALPKSEDYSGEVTAQTAQMEQPAVSEEHPLYRGGGDPLKGLNVAKPKEMVIGNYYALIIGIDKYTAPSWPQLVNAVNDAKALEASLKASYKFEFFRTLYNEQATREGIIKELEWLVAHAKENDNVFIYYSGHGEYKKELAKGYWVPVDAEANSTSRYISNSDIQTYINGIKSKHTLLVSDACFSGDIFRGNTISVPFEESEKYYREVQGLVSRQALTSGGLEPVMDGGKEGHSVFAYYLLKTLKDNQGKYFDVSQLYTKIKIPVINNSEQTPKLSPIKNAGDEGGQFIFIKK